MGTQEVQLERSGEKSAVDGSIYIGAQLAITSAIFTCNFAIM